MMTRIPVQSTIGREGKGQPFHYRCGEQRKKERKKRLDVKQV